MKLGLTVLMLCLFVAGQSISAQNSIKIFDAVAIQPSDSSILWSYESAVPFGTTQVDLYCPAGEAPFANLSGPSGGSFIVDNFLAVNGTNVCGGEASCFSMVFATPDNFLGEPMESAYLGIAPIDISGLIPGSGTYTFSRMDFGHTYGSSEVYLNTSCSLTPVITDPPTDPPTPSGNQVCHRDFGRRVQKTLTVGPNAVAAHLAHGDTAGPCL